jgi:ferredoxin
MADEVRLVVDTEVCVGIGQCEALEPDAFDYDEDAGHASFRGGASLPADRADVVIRSCPSGAISIAVDES